MPSCLTLEQEAEARLAPRYCPLKYTVRMGLTNRTSGSSDEHYTCNKVLDMRDCTSDVDEEAYRLFCPSHGYVPFGGSMVAKE